LQSPRYPYIEWNRIWQWIEEINDAIKREGQKLERAKIENQFIRSARNDK